MKRGTISYPSAFISAVLLAAFCIQASAEEPYKPDTKVRPTQTVFLYPEGQDSGKGVAEGPGESNGLTGDEVMYANGIIYNVNDNARFDLYLPQKPNGQLVIICPGGSYLGLSTFSEGAFVAEWLVQRNISACVLKYRLPNGHWTVPLTDIQNTIRYCRAHAGEWGITQIGVMGFSAGGHLAASASTLFSDKTTRPDFSILIYPWISMDPDILRDIAPEQQLRYLKKWDSSALRQARGFFLGPEEKWNDTDLKVDQWKEKIEQYRELNLKYSLEAQITKETPPTFLALSEDDVVVPMEQSIRYYFQLRENGIEAELHIFPKGIHGWGFNDEKYVGAGNDRFSVYRKQFEACLEGWMKNISK